MQRRSRASCSMTSHRRRTAGGSPSSHSPSSESWRGAFRRSWRRSMVGGANRRPRCRSCSPSYRRIHQRVTSSRCTSHDPRYCPCAGSDCRMMSPSVSRATGNSRCATNSSRREARSTMPSAGSSPSSSTTARFAPAASLLHCRCGTWWCRSWMVGCRPATHRLHLRSVSSTGSHSNSTSVVRTPRATW